MTDYSSYLIMMASLQNISLSDPLTPSVLDHQSVWALRQVFGDCQYPLPAAEMEDSIWQLFVRTTHRGLVQDVMPTSVRNEETC